MSRLFTCSPAYRIASKRNDPNIKKFIASSGARKCFVLHYRWIFFALNCHMCFRVPEFTEAKNLPPSSSELSLVNSPISSLESFATKIISSRDPRHWSIKSSEAHVLLGPISQDTIKSVPDRLLKRAAMVFAVGLYGLLHLYCPTYVYYRRWSWNLRNCIQ